MTQPQWIIYSIRAVVAAASLAGWFVVVRRWRGGLEPLPFEARAPIGWTGPECLLVIAAYVGCGVFGVLAVDGWYLRQSKTSPASESTGTAPAPTEQAQAQPAAAPSGEPSGESPGLLFRQLQGKILGDVLFLVVAALIFTKLRATPREQLGLAARPADDFRIGIAAFVLIVPPVILLQAGLIEFWTKSVHPVLVGLQQSRDVDLWALSTVAVVVTAPFVEEFLFRGVIQNWLSRAWSFAADPIVLPEGEIVPPTPLGEAFAHDGPIVCTAGLFALMHLGNGPDPIPLFFLALGLGYLFRQTNRIWPGWVVHLLLNSFSLAALPWGE